MTTPKHGFTLIELMIVIAILAITAAIAIPNLLESRLMANEAAAAATLKSGVFPGETQFKAGAYQDADADNIGEYGTIEALAGRIAATGIPAGNLNLVTGPLATQAGGAATREAHSYCFRGYVPSPDGATFWADGDGNLLSAIPVAAMTSNNAERCFTAAAAPQEYNSDGRKVFLLTRDGMVRSPSDLAHLSPWFILAPAPGVVATADSTSLDAGIQDAFGGTNISANCNEAAYPVYAK